MFDNEAVTTTAPDPLDAARAALAAAELRTGVRAHEGRLSRAETVSGPPDASWDEAPASPLASLLDGGRLPVGTAAVVAGSSSLLLALLAASQGAADWIAVVGMPSLGLLAAADAGLALSRLVVVPDVRGRAAETVAALIDGMSYVLVGPDAGLSMSDRRRLLARARDRGCGLVTTSEWEHASVRLRATARWSGAEDGAGYLRRCTIEVRRQARGTADTWTLTLPVPATGPLNRAQPGAAQLLAPRREIAPLRAVM